MLGLIVALVFTAWQQAEGTSRDYAVEPRDSGVVVRRVRTETTYTGSYGDRGIAVARTDATPFRGRRIKVVLTAAHERGTGFADAAVTVWGAEGVLAVDGVAHRDSLATTPRTSTFVLDVPDDAAYIEVSLNMFGDGEASIEHADIEVTDVATPVTAPVRVVPIDPSTRAEVTAALRAVSVPFDGGDSAFAAVARATREARVIGLGESAHGSAAEDDRCAAIFRYLALHAGARVLAVEMNFATAHRLEDYVAGRTADVPDALRESNFYAFQTRTFADLLAWMRRENAHRRGPDRLHVVGVDMIYAGPQRRFVEQRLAGVSPAAAAAARRAFACLLPGFGEPCLRAVRGVSGLIRTAFGARGAPDELHAARTVEQYVEQYTSGTVRDVAIAENMRWALERYPGARAVLWAHFFHASAACCLGHVTAGGELAKRYGNGYYALGLVFGAGEVRAIPAAGGDARVVPMPASPENTIENVLAGVGDDVVADFRAARFTPGVAAWLAAPHRLRRVDLFTDPARPETAWTDERLIRALDGVVFIRSTDAPAPL